MVFHNMVKAVASVRGDSAIFGTITFEQSEEHAPTTITWNLRGNDANSERAFHIHEFGDNTNGCTSAGPHCTSFWHSLGVMEGLVIANAKEVNPFGRTHGAPSDSERHVGDLGNFQTDSTGTSVGTMTDHLVKLVGPESIIGRTIVIHAGADDLGRRANVETKVTGNAGGRLACGVIGLSSGYPTYPRPRGPVLASLAIATSML